MLTGVGDGVDTPQTVTTIRAPAVLTKGKTQKAERYYVLFLNESHDDKDMKSDL